MPTGGRLAFRSDTTLVTGQVEMQPESSPLDITCDGQLHGSVPLARQEHFHFADLPPGDKLIELWLPQYGEFRLRSLKLNSGSSVDPHVNSQPRWTIYGSSITQCRTAKRPTETWPAIVARGHGLNLTCLGYGGNCHLDPMVARLIRNHPADVLSMKIGINVYNQNSLNLRTFRSAIIGFIQIVRERHPLAPFAILSPIYSDWRENTPNQVGFTVRAMREEVRATVDTLRAHGDLHLCYVDGLTILGPEHAGLLADKLHPDAEGYRVLGHNFLNLVMNKLLPSGGRR